MEKQITLSTNNLPADKGYNLYCSVADAAQSARKTLAAPLRWLQRYYSSALERPVSVAQARLLTTVQAAFFLTVLPADYPLLLRCAACAWFVSSLLRCRREI